MKIYRINIENISDETIRNVPVFNYRHDFNSKLIYTGVYEDQESYDHLLRHKIIFEGKAKAIRIYTYNSDPDIQADQVSRLSLCKIGHRSADGMDYCMPFEFESAKEEKTGKDYQVHTRVWKFNNSSYMTLPCILPKTKLSLLFWVCSDKEESTDTDTILLNSTEVINLSKEQ